MDFKVAYNSATRTATVIAPTSALPTGSVDVGNFSHADITDNEGASVSHVLYHHVQDLLLKHGVEDMGRVSIVNDSGYANVQGLFLNRSAVVLQVGETSQIKVEFIPREPTNQGLNYESSDSSAVGVSATGLITALAETGVNPVYVTVTTKEGGFTAKVAVEVTQAD